MTTVTDMRGPIYDRLEEDRDNPVFWSPASEIDRFVIEGTREATLLSGEPETRTAAPFTLAANTRIFSIPSDAVVLLRIEAGGSGAVKKRMPFDLDQQYPGWEKDTGPAILAWFPLGMTQFGIWPLLTAPITVVLTSVVCPLVNTTLIPFQDEFIDGITSYAAHVARLKEGGSEFAESMNDYNYFLRKMQEMGKFAGKKASIRFTRTGGIPSKVTEVTVR